MTRLVTLPVLVVIALFGVVGPSPALAVGLGLVAAVPLVVQARIDIGKLGQVALASLILVFGALVLDAAFASPPVSLIQLRSQWSTFAGTSLLITLPRLYIRKPLGDGRGTIALALVGLTACGGTYSAEIYVPAVLIFAITALVARRYADRGSAPIGRLDAFWLLPAGLLLLIATTVAFSVSSSLPILHSWAVDRISQYALPRAGFTDRMWLGTMRGMLMSEQKVLRVRGGRVDHLRGIVYDRYGGGRWSSASGHAMRTVAPPEHLDDSSGAGVITLEILERDPDRYFLPLEATKVAVSSGVARVDDAAIVAPIAAEPATHVWFRSDGARDYPISPAGDADLQVPPDLVQLLAELAARWTAGAVDRAAELDAIEERLISDFSYSLDFEHSGRIDPIVEFLFRRRTGHCEYFASAMTLLARSRGIPARVVGGYRVTEKNEMGDYYVVRERNAHTWVEAWLPGQGWRTYDPTPPGEIISYSRTRMGWFASVADLASSSWTAFLRWLDRRTWLEMVSAPVLFVLLLFAVRWLRSRRGRTAGEKASTDAPLPCFRQLSDALAARGVVRGTGETLEQLAARLLAEGLEHGRGAAELLRRYAALRYGDRGDLRDLDRDIRRWCEQLEG